MQVAVGAVADLEQFEGKGFGARLVGYLLGTAGGAIAGYVVALLDHRRDVAE